MPLLTEKKISVAPLKLVHYPLCPLSRFIRMLLTELKQDTSLIEEEFWLQRDQFLKLNPSGYLPVLIDIERNNIIGDIYPIFEYLLEKFKTHNLFSGYDLEALSEIRRLLSWCHYKFYHDISYPLIHERLIKPSLQKGAPDSTMLRNATYNIHKHFVYLSSLLEERHWFAGSLFSCADLAIAAHISVVDYLGNITWSPAHNKEEFDVIHEWYARIKSRRSFRILLDDKVNGFRPPEYYANPDF